MYYENKTRKVNTTQPLWIIREYFVIKRWTVAEKLQYDLTAHFIS